MDATAVMVQLMGIAGRYRPGPHFGYWVQRRARTNPVQRDSLINPEPGP